ncbi:hypothetical protein ACIQNI_29855 [Streptomyces sp. NPDC091266]|uniref:hypothetical protein n=1 Tax=Streptomyces sp. NPDC091266 TaxID=3365978 RepID=UPI003823DB86
MALLTCPNPPIRVTSHTYRGARVPLPLGKGFALTALISLDAHGHLSIPNLAARYSFQRKESGDTEWRTLDRYTMPDGTLAGATAELAGAVLLHTADSIATVRDDGTLTLYASHVRYRFSPVPGWERMTSAHALANCYGVEATHAGRGTWSAKDALKNVATAHEVSILAADAQAIGSDVSVHTTGVLIVETRAAGIALRLTPLRVASETAAKSVSRR